MGVTDSMTPMILYHEPLEPTYRFLVESGLLYVGYYAEIWGGLLGGAAGLREPKRYSLVEYLLQKGADPDQRSFMHGDKTALAAAASWSDPQMIGLLLDYGARLAGSGALVSAAEKGKKDNVEYLLSRGAEVNEMVSITYSRPGMEAARSALHAAVKGDHVEIVDVLLAAGADVTLEDAKGRTTVDIARSAKAPDAAVLAKL